MKKKIFITGGCGFIGSNAALYFYQNGWDVTVFDNLSRKGTDTNLTWLNLNGNFNFINGDVRDYKSISSALSSNSYDFILHLAAQVAVTTSVVNPREDFEINALGTLNLLEAAKYTNKNAFILFSSTNKVYGKLDHVKITERDGRYEYENLVNGVSESESLDFYSPYGCSKGAADQYVIDYSRIFNLKTCVFRQSCIYGIRQFGVEDQGWVAWFTIAALLNKNISIYGNGKQVRDILFVDDLVRAYELAYNNKEKVNGQAFNVGGGTKNTLSLLELISILNKKLNLELNPAFAETRPGDQKVFVSDISKFSQTTGWEPKIDSQKGVEMLIDWVSVNRSLLCEVLE